MKVFLIALHYINANAIKQVLGDMVMNAEWREHL